MRQFRELLRVIQDPQMRIYLHKQVFQFSVVNSEL